MQLPPYTASVPGGSGQWNSCNALPHCLGAVGGATPATVPNYLRNGQWNSFLTLPHCPGAVRTATVGMHCLTAWGQSAVQLVHCTAALLGGSGQWNNCNALPHCPGQWAVLLLKHCLTGGSWQCNSCYTVPHCPGVVSIGNPALHCRTAQRAVRLRQCTASLPWGQWAVLILQYTAALPGAVGTPSLHLLTPRGQWAVQLLQCTASLPGGSGPCNSCRALPHFPGAVGSGTPATHYLAAWGQWAVQVLQCIAAVPGGSGQ